MAESDQRADILDAAARHIADRLAISYPFAMRKLKQYMMEKAVSGGIPVTDSDIPEFAAEVVNVELSEYGNQVTNSAQKAATGEDRNDPGLVSAIHYRDLQKQNANQQRIIEDLRNRNEHLQLELTQVRSVADASAGEVEGLRSSIEIFTEALLRRVGPVHIPLANTFMQESRSEVR